MLPPDNESTGACRRCSLALMFAAVIVAAVIGALLGAGLGTLAGVIAFVVALAVQGVLALYTDWYTS